MLFGLRYNAGKKYHNVIWTNAWLSAARFRRRLCFEVGISIMSRGRLHLPSYIKIAKMNLSNFIRASFCCESSHLTPSICDSRQCFTTFSQLIPLTGVFSDDIFPTYPVISCVLLPAREFLMTLLIVSSTASQSSSGRGCTSVL